MGPELFVSHVMIKALSRNISLTDVDRLLAAVGARRAEEKIDARAGELVPATNLKVPGSGTHQSHTGPIGLLDEAEAFRRAVSEEHLDRNSSGRGGCHVVILLRGK